MSHRKSLAVTIVAAKRDTDEAIAALRLQAMAWRLLAMIALVDQEKARQQAQWLLFRTVPFTDGAAVEQYIAENGGLAREYGIKAGVFALDTTPAAGKRAA